MSKASADKLRVVITGGGTGGHLYPALAVADALKADPAVEAILYIGNLGRREAEVVPQHGIDFEGLVFSGMPRKPGPALIKWLFSLGRSFVEAHQILQAFKPHVVFATGGYVTAPVLLASRASGIPFVVHEPDAHPGLVNRALAPWSAAATCAFSGARSRLKAKQIVVTGNPLRSDIGNIRKDEALRKLNLPFTLEKPVLLVTGGSQGAQRINQAVLDALPILLNELGLQVIHQVGEKPYQAYTEACPAAYCDHPAYVFRPFFTDMASALALADLAVSRSGSMSLSEMYQAHIPTILVPYPYAAADHQRHNALASEQAGASLMIDDADFTGPAFVTAIRDLLSQPGHLDAMRQAAAALSTPQATRDVIAVIRSVVD